MNGMIVVCFTLIAVVCCTFGAPVEIEPESKNVAVRASALLQPQSNSATVATASPLVSAKSSITEHQHHKRRRHHRRRHRLQRHRHKLYPLKDRLQKFVRGSSGSSNLLAGVKTPHQDFEMNNGEVFEHGGVPDLSEPLWSPQLVRKYHHKKLHHKSNAIDASDRRSIDIKNDSINSTKPFTSVDSNATTITNDSSTKAKMYWDHTSRLINYLVKSYKDVIGKGSENVTKNVAVQRDETKNTTEVKSDEKNKTVNHTLLKPPSNPSPDSEQVDTRSSNSSDTNKEIQEMKEIHQPKEDQPNLDSTQAPRAKEIKEEGQIQNIKVPLQKNHPAPINPDDININDIVATSNTGVEECSNDNDDCAAETGDGDDKVHYDKKTSAKDSEAQFESEFQKRIDSFVADKTFSSKPLFHVGNGGEGPCINDDDNYEGTDALTTRHTPCAPYRPHHHRHHNHHYVGHHHTPNHFYQPHQHHPMQHWNDLAQRRPLQMHLYNNSNDESLPQYGSHYSSHNGFHDVPQQEMVGNTPLLYSPHAPSSNIPTTVMGTLGGSGSRYSPVENVQTPIQFGGYTVTGSKPDPQHNQVHLYTGPRQVHLFKAYNTSDISLNTNQQLQQILNKDIRASQNQRDLCHGNECSGGVQFAGTGFGSLNLQDQPPIEENGFHDHMAQPQGMMPNVNHGSDMNQMEVLDDDNHGYHNEDTA